ncbi:MAG: tetratricopeptide repeat protein [Chloroflexota bacterium]|nr:tetratricopeptide repeat protein [Chloroflexia bacterium]MDQ3226694.1 tetratricopeptide repeat protein [Chloroflexota bacterium]
MTSLQDWLGFRRRESAGDSVLLIAREVTDRQRSVQGGLSEIRDPRVLDRLTAEEFEGLDMVIEEQAGEDREYAVVLARLTYAAARAKGFDDQLVDAALRLDTLLPGDDPSHERERLLRDAYGVAQRSGYVEGGRAALSRLGLRAIDAGDTERARALLRQQLELGDEEDDDIAEVNAALALGDLLRKEGERAEAQGLFRRAGRGAQRLDYQHGIAEALVRQIEMLPRNTDLETMAALQRQASEAARRTADLGLQSRIVLSLAETLRRNGKIPEAVSHLEEGLAVSRQIGDLALEGRCLATLVDIEHARGRLAAAAGHERDLVTLEDRRGNRAGAGEWAIRMGTSLLDLDDIPAALEAFSRGLELATAAGDVSLEQRALGGIGMGFARAGRRSESLEHLMRALDLSRAARDRRNEARWLATLGQVLWRFEQPQEAMRALTDGLAAAHRVEDLGLQANILTQLGRMYAAGGQTARAKEAYTHAYGLNRRLGQTDEQIDLLNLLSALAAETGQFPAATAFGEQALRLAEMGNDRLTEARLRMRLGRLGMSRGDTAAALDHFTNGVALAEAMAQPAIQAQALTALAGAQTALNDPAAAVTYRRALNQARSAGDAAGEAQAALGLGQLLLQQGARVEGSQMLQEAGAAARRLGARGQNLARRADDLIAGIGSLDPTPSRSARRREPATEQPVRTETATETVAPATTPVDAAPEGSGDSVFRETTLPPL